MVTNPDKLGVNPPFQNTADLKETDQTSFIVYVAEARAAEFCHQLVDHRISAEVIWNLRNGKVSVHVVTNPDERGADHESCWHNWHMRAVKTMPINDIPME